MSAIARHLPPKRLYNSQIVQMNGAANEITSGIAYSGAILERFGQSFGADVQQFPVPALFDDPLTKQLMWRERSVRPGWGCSRALGWREAPSHRGLPA